MYCDMIKDKIHMYLFSICLSSRCLYPGQMAFGIVLNDAILIEIYYAFL